MKSDQSPDDAKGGMISRRKFMGHVAAGSALVVVGLPVLDAGAEPAVSTTAAAGAETVEVRLSVNGSLKILNLDPRVTLLDALREKLALMGTKKGGDHGQCGACTVLVDGRRTNSCLRLAAMCQNEEITTVEGLAKAGDLHPMQAAFIKHDAFQCGYCTPAKFVPPSVY